MKKQRGFTLIELLIVVAIIGIIAAIAIPNLLNAVNRGRQKRTMADIRSIATAIESYSVDNNFYPKVASAQFDTQDIRQYLEPTYIRRAPQNDGWGTVLHFIGDSTNGREYTLWSAARDKNATLAYTGGPQTSFDSDIVFSNGSFTQWPEGIQQ